MDVGISKRGIPIRLPLERWFHIEESHDELAGRHSEVLSAIEDPDMLVRGYAGEVLAIKRVEAGKSLVVVYRERSADDGFVITAYLTRRARLLMKRGGLWRKNP